MELSTQHLFTVNRVEAGQETPSSVCLVAM